MDKRALRAEQFPVTKNVIYWNHAAVGPLSVVTADAMRRHAEDQRDFGALHWRSWYGEHARAKKLAAELIGADASEISILKNTSEGLAFVAEGFRWKAGENVVTTDMEFPSNFTPWKRLERRGVECRTVTSSDGAYTPGDVERMIDARTRIVAVSYVSFHNGFAPDLDAIGALCASRGVLLCVDAIQGLGVLPLDVRRSHISFLASDGHKWLLGPEGAAIFYCSPEAREQLEVIEGGWMNLAGKSASISGQTEFLPDGRRFEAGSLNTNGLYGLAASLQFILSIGVPEIGAEVVGLAGRFAVRVEEIGWIVASPKPIRSGIVGILPPGMERLGVAEREPRIRELHAALEKRNIVVAPREGMLRFSPHFYNDDGELEEIIAALQSLT